MRLPKVCRGNAQTCQHWVISMCNPGSAEKKVTERLNPEEKRLLRREQCCSGAITAAATNVTGRYTWCVCPILTGCCLGACTVWVREGQNQSSLHLAACVDQILTCSQPWGVLPRSTACPDMQHHDPVHWCLWLTHHLQMAAPHGQRLAPSKCETLAGGLDHLTAAAGLERCEHQYAASSRIN